MYKIEDIVEVYLNEYGSTYTVDFLNAFLTDLDYIITEIDNVDYSEIYIIHKYV